MDVVSQNLLLVLFPLVPYRSIQRSSSATPKTWAMDSFSKKPSYLIESLVISGKLKSVLFPRYMGTWYTVLLVASSLCVPTSLKSVTSEK